MPHDVTMPQLGMAQDAGKIVNWLKQPGDKVARGDALFEVETDKATMEVEAQADGFLTGVRAAAGDDVPVGQRIARITDSPEEEIESPSGDADPDAATDQILPDGRAVTMPQLGMAQDRGLLVGWQKQPGDRVAADDVLFEVETDKSTMEVPAGIDGYLAATLAEAGEDIPVGAAVAIISAEAPARPVARAFGSGPAPEPAPPSGQETRPQNPGPAASPPVSKPVAAPPAGGRILASPKARRLAAERGLDLSRLVAAGHPQPYHVADIEVLVGLPAPASATGVAGAAPAQRLTADLDGAGLDDLIGWLAEAGGATDSAAILAGFAGASLGTTGPAIVSVERFGDDRSFTVPAGRALSAVTEAEKTGGPPALLLRDLRGTRLRHVSLGAGDLPVLTLTGDAAGLTVTLECSAAQLPPGRAIALITEFAGRLDQPLRHLL